MRCRQKEACTAYKNPYQQCWEMAQAARKIQYKLAVCQDCMVCVVKKAPLELVDRTGDLLTEDTLPAMDTNSPCDGPLSQ